jgi:hypothetical protein
MLYIDAAVLGCCVLGKACYIARYEFGARGMIAGDILQMLPEALRGMEGE